MTRRERMERRLEKREAWAGSAAKESDRRFDTARQIADSIPLGQPILVGHHSEKRHRRDVDRMASNMTRACEAQERAKHHTAVAGTLADRLETNIFSDDADAIEALEARIREREAEAERCKAINAALRREMKKGDGWLARVDAALALTDAEKRAMENNVKFDWTHAPMFPGYHLTNLRGRITADRERIKTIQTRQKRAAEAEAAGGIVVKTHGADYVSVTFADKPDYPVLAELKAAGFHWSNGCWYGKAEALPERYRATA